MENLVKYVNNKMRELDKSEYDFESLFNIIHNQGDRIFSERIKDYVNSYKTYKEIKEDIIKVSSVINNYIDDKDSEFIGIYLDNSDEFVIIFWALLANGYKPLLLNKRFPDNLVNVTLEIAKCKTIISDKLDLKIDGKIINYLDIINSNDKGIIDINNLNWANEIALTTSATSLNIKICVYDGKSICNQIINSKDIIKSNRMIKSRYKGCIKQLAFLPFYHVFGLIACYFWFSFFGRSFVFLNDYRPETILNTVRFHKVTHVFAVPLLWNQIAKTIRKKARDQGIEEYLDKQIDKSIRLQSIFPILGRKIVLKKNREVNDQIFGDSIRFCITGGSFISNDTLKLINGLGYSLFQGYGMSEIGITSVNLEKKAKLRIDNSIGNPLKTIEYKTSNGELLVKGKSIASRIITKDSDTIINKDEYFHTKDLIELDNNKYFLKGRIDDICIGDNGENLSPDIYEKEISIESCLNFSLLSLDGKNLSLVIEVLKRNNELVKKKITNDIDNAINNLSKLGITLDGIFVTYDMLCSPNAIKVSRTILKKSINEGKISLIKYNDYKNNNNDANFDSDITNSVKKIFGIVLDKNIDEINNDSHFMNDLGGSSLDYLTLLMKLNEEFLIDFNNSSRSFYTVNDFVSYINDKIK